MDAEQKRKQKDVKHSERIRTKKILGIHFMRSVIGRQAGGQLRALQGYLLSRCVCQNWRD